MILTTLESVYASQIAITLRPTNDAFTALNLDLLPGRTVTAHASFLAGERITTIHMSARGLLNGVLDSFP